MGHVLDDGAGPQVSPLPAQRTRAQLAPDESLEPVIARFAARVSKFSGRVDRAAVERILDTAAKAIADLEVSSEQ